MDKNIKIFPYRNLPIIESSHLLKQDREDSLSDWLGNNEYRKSIVYLGKDLDTGEFFGLIGRMYEGRLVTTAQILKELSSNVVLEMNICSATAQIELINHLDPYYKRIKWVPPWGCLRFYELLMKGATPKKLRGKHKDSNTPKDHYRLCVSDDKNALIYGPLSSFKDVYKINYLCYR